MPPRQQRLADDLPEPPEADHSTSPWMPSSGNCSTLRAIAPAGISRVITTVLNGVSTIEMMTVAVKIALVGRR